jgi:two-component system response regulator CpxR
MTRLLMVDDDIELCEMVSEYLKLQGFSVDAVHDGASGLQAAQRNDYALLLLDVMLPQMNGIEVIQRLRSMGSTLPVLMLTARGDASDRVLGLEVGSDDYLAKPFDERELVARLRAILRRVHNFPSGAANEVLRVGDIEINLGARCATRHAEPIPLTSVEFEILTMLLRAAGTVVERDAIARQVLGRPLLHFDRSIDTHISRLRRKLGPREGGGERIVTLRSVGYLYTK